MSRSVGQERKLTRGSNAAMFRSTARSINRRASRTRSTRRRAILCDDTSMDFLTNMEMSQALRVAEFAADEADVVAIFGDKPRLDQMMGWGNEGALRHLSIIGMDACLMAMIEVQYQVRKFADVMVASQEVEPMHGWPYDTILAELTARPIDGARGAGRADRRPLRRILRRLTAAGEPDVTQSAIDLSRLGEAADLVHAFARSAGQGVCQRDLFLKKAYNEMPATRPSATATRSRTRSTSTWSACWMP